jgi:hypothetical protein
MTAVADAISGQSRCEAPRHETRRHGQTRGSAGKALVGARVHITLLRRNASGASPDGERDRERGGIALCSFKIHDAERFTVGSRPFRTSRGPRTSGHCTSRGPFCHLPRRDHRQGLLPDETSPSTRRRHQEMQLNQPEKRRLLTGHQRGPQLICPLAATKKTSWPSQSVTGFASRRAVTLLRTPTTIGLSRRGGSGLGGFHG